MLAAQAASPCCLMKTRPVPNRRPLSPIIIEGKQCYKVTLTKGDYAIIDSEDAPLIARHSWHSFDHRYAARKGVGKQVFMHREIANTPEGCETDHKNRNGFDNRRCNLRTASRSQNECNSARYLKKTSRYRGVCKPVAITKWKAAIKLNGKSYGLGHFSSEEAAARAYDCAAKRLHGEFAQLNFKEEHAV